MTQTFNRSLAIFAALVLTLSSIGTIVSVPPAHASSSVSTVEMA